VSDGHRTSTIPRPARDRTTAADHTSFGDFTRPIPRDKQLVKGRGKRSVVVLAALVVAAALIASLFVLPVQAWLSQRNDIATKQHELSVLQQANAELALEVRRLNTPDGVREAAREEIGFTEPGEVRLTVLPTPNAPLTLPAGWPYDAVGQIIAARASAQSTPASTPQP
jgi:cell division protein FtsB